MARHVVARRTCPVHVEDSYVIVEVWPVALHGGPAEAETIASPVLTMEDAMSWRLLTVALITAGALLATQAFAQLTVSPGTSDRMGGGGGKGAATSKSGSDRMGGGGGGKGAAGVTTVKSSKSNSSDRMGGGGGGKGAMKLNPQPEPPGRR